MGTRTCVAPLILALRWIPRNEYLGVESASSQDLEGIQLEIFFMTQGFRHEKGMHEWGFDSRACEDC